MDPREIKLPMWAQELINTLRARLDISRDPLLTEVAKLRPQVELLKERNGALTELLQCAAKGGHTTSVEIMNIINEFDLVLAKKEG